MPNVTMSNFLMDDDTIAQVRRELWSESGNGYYIFRNFLNEHQVEHARDIWTNPAIEENFIEFPGKDAICQGCLNSRGGDESSGKYFFNFFWNQPVDEVTHMASFATVFLRSALMGQYPLVEPFGYGPQGSSYRVIKTISAETWIAKHRDYLRVSDDPQISKISFDTSRLQATLYTVN